jgi:hypothetical protein
MKSPMDSNLICLISKAIDDCFYNAEANVDDGNGISIFAEWVDSKRSGYAVIHLTISENGVPKFSYDDYGTECKM